MRKIKDDCKGFKFGARTSHPAAQGKRMFHFWLSNPRAKKRDTAGKTTLTDELCQQCDFRLKPKACVEHLLKLKKKSKSSPLFAMWPTKDRRHCTVNKKKGIKPPKFRADWAEHYYGTKASADKVRGKKASEQQKKLNKEFKQYRDKKNPDGSYSMLYIKNKDLFMKGLKLGLIRKDPKTNRWVIVPIRKG